MKRILTLLLIFVMSMQLGIPGVFAEEAEITIAGIDYSAGTPSQVSESGSAMVHTPNPLGWKVSLPYKSNAIKLVYRTAKTEYGVLNIRLGGPSGEIIGTLETDKVATVWADYTNVIYLTKPLEGNQEVWITTTKGTVGKGGAHWIKYITFLKDNGTQSFATLEEKDAYTDIGEDVNSHEINILTDLGFFSNTDAFFMPYKPMTRKEFVCTFGEFIDAEQYATADSPFSDVEAGTEEAKVLSGLYQIGIIHGYTDGTFRPASFITPTEAIILCLNALGYKGVSANPADMNSLAKRLDLLDGINFTNKVTKSQAARLFYNLLLANYLAVDGVADDEIIYRPTKNYLENATAYKNEQGVVTANQYTKLYTPQNGTGISIDGIKYKLGDGVDASYLGVYCEFFYHEEGGERVLDVIRPMPETEWSYVESTKEIYFTEISERKIEFIDYLEDEEYEYELSSKTAIIYNGVALTKSLASLIPDPEAFEGSLTLIDNDADDVLDTIWIDHANRIIKLEAVSKGVFVDALATNPDDKLYDTTKKQFIAFKDGRNALADELMPGTILTMYESAEGGSEQLVRAMVDENSVEGTIMITTEDRYEIDGVEYRASQACKDELYIGLSGKFLLDRYGFIVTCEEETESEPLVGLYMANNDGGTQGLDPVAQVQMLTSAGIEIFTVAPKVTADGVTVKTTGEFYNGKGDFLGMESVEANSPVRYRLNSRNQLVMIDTINDGTGDRNDQLTNLFLEVAQEDGVDTGVENTSKKPVYSKACLIYGSAAIIDPSGSYIPRFGCDLDNVTSIIISANKGSEDKWKIVKNSVVSLDNKLVKIAPYSFERDSKMADLVVLIDHPSYMSSFKDPFVFEYVSECLDGKGNVTKKLHGYSSTAKISYLVNADSLGSNARLKEMIGALKEGYLVSPSVENNEITDLEIIYIPEAEDGEKFGPAYWGNPQDTAHETILNKNDDKRSTGDGMLVGSMYLLEFVNAENKFINCRFKDKQYVFNAKTSSVTICEKNSDGTYTYLYGMPVSSILPDEVVVAKRSAIGGILGSIYVFRDNSK